MADGSSAPPDAQGFVEHKGSTTPTGAEKRTTGDGGDVGVEINADRSRDLLLWEEELEVRKQVANSAISGNFVGAFFLNTYAALYILVKYLISLESLLSIALSVGMTICKFGGVGEICNNYRRSMAP